MSEEIKVGNSLIQDGDGNVSSGRVVKLVCAGVAVAFGTAGLFLLIKNSDQILADYCFKLTALFLSVATGTELVQKITGR